MASNSARRARVWASKFVEAFGAGVARDAFDLRGALGRRGPRRRRARALRRSAPAASRSSATLKPAGTLASNGKRCSRRSQKAWIVWIFSPPGVSIARANRRRAKARLARPASARRVRAIASLQARVVEAGPRRQRLEHARRHVGGGGLGEGQTEQARRARRRRSAAAARAGSAHGSCPSRRWPRPRPRLRDRKPGAGARAPGAESEPRAAHASSAVASSDWPAVADHSLTRARWS